MRWQPGPDTWIALASLLAMIPVYYVGTHPPNNLIGLGVFTVVGNGLLNVALPVYYVVRVRGEGLGSLGITMQRWKLALALSVACSVVFWRGLYRQLDAHPGVDPVPHLVFNGLILWEPLFVFGWLQLRWERAFGVVPGILLAGLSLGIYHLGTYPLLGIAGLVGIGVFYASLFRIARNLLALWPLTWAVGSSLGTLQGGFQMGWPQVRSTRCSWPRRSPSSCG